MGGGGAVSVSVSFKRIAVKDGGEELQPQVRGVNCAAKTADQAAHAGAIICRIRQRVITTPNKWS